MTRLTVVTLAFVVFHAHLEDWRTGDPLHEPYRATMVWEDGAPPAATVRLD